MGGREGERVRERERGLKRERGLERERVREREREKKWRICKTLYGGKAFGLVEHCTGKTHLEHSPLNPLG